MMIEISGLQITIAVVVFVLAIVVQTTMLGYWGGSLTTLVKEHERRLNKIEKKIE